LPRWAPLPDFQISSDASGTLGYGAIFMSHWFSGSWSDTHRKVRIFYIFFLFFYFIIIIYFFLQCDRCLGLVWGLMAGLQGTASHESGMFVWGLALEVEAPG
jgi:hypothetical protein